MIQFTECVWMGYRARTEENVVNSQCTIAIATDFTTAGERATKNLCIQHNRLYIPVDYNNKDISIARVQRIADILNERKITSINGAGNGIYTLDEPQQHINTDVTLFLIYLQELLTVKIDTVCSGGQTGIDEAFLVAAQSQAIPNIICRAPKGWKFRRVDGVDISDEFLFKKRFEI